MLLLYVRKRVRFFSLFYLFVHASYGDSYFLCLPSFYRVLFCNVLHTKGSSQCTRCTAQCENTRRGKYLRIHIKYSFFFSFLARLIFLLFRTTCIHRASVKLFITYYITMCSHMNATNKRWTHAFRRQNDVTVKSIRNISAVILHQVAEQNAHRCYYLLLSSPWTLYAFYALLVWLTPLRHH